MSASDAVRSHVITVGEELLSGATVDGNAAWLGRRLGDLGAPVAARTTVGDRDDDIARALRTAVAEVEVTVLTGGLGPTEDDRTRTAVAAELGERLVEDPELVAALDAHARARERPLTPELRSLALRPVSGRALPNPAGAAPGLVFRRPQDRPGWVVLLPGVPREMRALFPQVETLLLRTFEGRLTPVVSRMIHTTGTPESILAPRVENALGSDRAGVEVAYLPDLGGVDLRLTTRRAPGESAGDAAARLDAAEGRLGSVLEGMRFDAASGDLAETVLGALERRGLHLAVAESCTGGML
ncbi:MAG: CinA family protein, partial [Gemmatimonadetes bacterium]|nr:CinA family protein [Gemmatimonadota bacterium]